MTWLRSALSGTMPATSRSPCELYRCLLRPVRDCIDRLLDPSALEAEPDILEAAVANVLCEVLCARVEVKQDLVMIGHWILGTE